MNEITISINNFIKITNRLLQLDYIILAEKLDYKFDNKKLFVPKDLAISSYVLALNYNINKISKYIIYFTPLHNYNYILYEKATNSYYKIISDIENKQNIYQIFGIPLNINQINKITTLIKNNQELYYTNSNYKLFLTSKKLDNLFYDKYDKHYSKQYENKRSALINTVTITIPKSINTEIIEAFYSNCNIMIRKKVSSYLLANYVSNFIVDNISDLNDFVKLLLYNYKFNIDYIKNNENSIEINFYTENKPFNFFLKDFITEWKFIYDIIL